MRSKRQSSRVKTDTCLKENHGVCQSFQANKGGDEGSEEANNSLENKTQTRQGRRSQDSQTAQGDATEPRPHTAAISLAPILLLSLGTSHCIRVNTQPPATHSNNPNT